MAQVTLSVGGVSYVVGCQDGEEDHLRALAKSISQRLEDVHKTLAPRGDKEAFFLVSLLLADELYEAHNKRMTAEEKAALARSQQLEIAHQQLTGRVADAATMAQNLLQRVEEHLKPVTVAVRESEAASSPGE